MTISRAAKILMVSSLALFAFLVTFGNITDYASNDALVRHVLSMDTTFAGSALHYRAIVSPPVWRLAYLLIITMEGLTCLAFGVGAAALFRQPRGGVEAFEHAKRFTVLGAGLAFLLWFTGFMTIGGEWFAMWRSQMWNGQQAAFRFYITVLAVVIFVNQPEVEPAYVDIGARGTPRDNTSTSAECRAHRYRETRK